MKPRKSENFPYHARELLTYCKQQGMSWDEAWAYVEERIEPHGKGWRVPAEPWDSMKAKRQRETIGSEWVDR